MDLITFDNNKYPQFQSEGFASKFAFPYAKEVCKGRGVDVGCNRIEWMLYSENYNDNLYEYTIEFTDNDIGNLTFPIDPILDYSALGRTFDAMYFPKFCDNLDFVFSSHCLEHLDGWVGVLDYWTSRLHYGGVLFLYLPDYSQHYWRPWNNRKHKNIFTPEIIYDYMVSVGYVNIFKSGVDLNNSFMIFGEKHWKE